MSTKRKPSTIAAPVVKQSAKIPTKTRIDETRASVAIGLSQNPESIADDSGDSDPNPDVEEEEDDDDQSKDQSTVKPAQPEETTPEVSKIKTTEDGDVEMEQAEGEDADEAPSFGELMHGNSTVDVTASLAAKGSTKAGSGGKNGEVAPVSAISMGITLEQALKTDDNELLESVLQLNNVEMIQNTINRMDSALAGILLSKLAARMHRRPGRAYSLMNWIQWTIIAHGGALVGQPETVKKLEELNRVLEERSRGLPALLALKGKLDMLDSQIRFRKAIKAQNSKGKIRRGPDGDESDESEDDNVDEPGVVFVEEEHGIRAIMGKSRAYPDDDDVIPAVNGVGEDSDEDSEDDGDFVDEDEMEEEEMDDDEVNYDDVEESGDEESDNEDSGPPAKKRK
ncbi:Dip2/Utp12 family-domain-containing protein [Rhypophila decipiens]|uniref:Dip2/Utp12 family-domain-containing protein n=1 Tax=Rhypophila decipiens TaxID=261697 RepID=A0AAN6Y8T5_9PEZI|nr:Dip2/Utp12 family-domain-containing protein [Rhypophila decipiens]